MKTGLIIIFVALLLDLCSQNVNLHLPEYKIQQREIWMDIIGFSAMSVAGFANGIREVQHAEPDIFGKGTCYVCDEAWKHKYRDYDGGDFRPAYPGAKSFLSWTTELRKTANSTKTVGILGGSVLLTMNEKFTFKKTGVRLLAGFVTYGLTSHVTYNHLRTGKPF